MPDADLGTDGLADSPTLGAFADVQRVTLQQEHAGRARRARVRRNPVVVEGLVQGPVGGPLGLEGDGHAGSLSACVGGRLTRQPGIKKPISGIRA